MASMFATNTDFNDLLDDGHFNFGGGNCSVEELFNPHVSSSQSASGTAAQSGGLLRPRKNSIIEGRRLSFSFSPGSSSLDFAAFDYWLSADTNPSSSTNPGSSSSGSGSLTGTSPYQPLYYRRLSTAAIQPPSFLNFGGLTSPSISRSPSPSPVCSIIHTPGHSEYSPEEHSAMDLDSSSSTNSSSSPPGLECPSGGFPPGGQLPLDPADYFFSGELAVEVQQPIAVSGNQPTPAGVPTAVFKQTICASPKAGGTPTASLQQYQFPAPAAAAAAAALQGLPSISAQTLFSLEENNPAEFRKAVIDACEKIFSGEGPFTAPAAMLPKGPSLLPASGQLSVPGQVPLLPAPAKLPINSNAVLPVQPPIGSSGPSAPALIAAKKAPAPAATPNGNGSKNSSSSKKPKQPKSGKQDKQDKKVHLDLRRTKTSRLKWSAELQDIFVATVERLGITAVPSTILEEMNVSGLTRENVASHLQKYRQHCIRGTMGRMQKKKKAEQAKLAAAAAMKQALAPAPAPAPPTSTTQPLQPQLPTMAPSAGPAEGSSVAPPNLVAPALASLAEVTPAPLPLDTLHQRLQSQPASSEQPAAQP